ncbi:hypothetical protein AJ78_04677 [Emergomyces pasteurianus Ep9510]|uniref:Uncharacterized protein n=1 Tax=Emergomyces pasteurianus Ep9510 TaxID=1447872 RepID=A0A1J9PGE7_9EURO|nr:hypothetical protein AJ78_04677 [Emergomyces pasteurianus Ep9510]
MRLLAAKDHWNGVERENVVRVMTITIATMNIRRNLRLKNTIKGKIYYISGISKIAY